MDSVLRRHIRNGRKSCFVAIRFGYKTMDKGEGLNRINPLKKQTAPVKT